MYKVLTIAGSDCSGGAGIQADIKTITAHKMYAMSVITALTAQNTTGVYGIHDTPAEFVRQQLDCIFTDIVPDAVKIGMVSNAEIITIIADTLKKYNAQNIVVDPVMVSTSGGKLLNDSASKALIDELLPIATVITPNIQEAEALCGFQVKDKEDMQKAAEWLGQNISGAVLVKGGHLKDSADDLLYTKEKTTWFCGKRVPTENSHGTGCTLSSSIACNLAKGATLEQSVAEGKDYITGALQDGLVLGKGNGPLNHMYQL